MEAYTSTLGLLTYFTHTLTRHSLTHSLTRSLICPYKALVSHLKLVPGFRAWIWLPDDIMLGV